MRMHEMQHSMTMDWENVRSAPAMDTNYVFENNFLKMVIFSSYCLKIKCTRTSRLIHLKLAISNVRFIQKQEISNYFCMQIFGHLHCLTADWTAPYNLFPHTNRMSLNIELSITMYPTDTTYYPLS